MAVNRWIGGGAVTRAQVGTFTIAGTPAAGNTVGVTINGKNVSYTLITGDDTTTTASGLADALRAATDGEFKLITWTNDAAIVTATAATPGVPYTPTGAGSVTTTATGGGATNTHAAVTANSSPNDVSDTANWSAGSLPVGADDVLIEATDQPLLWNLSALSAVTLASLKVRDSFAPQSASWVGNPVVHPTLGFREFRGSELTVQGVTTLEVNLNANAPAGAFQFNVGAVACALKVTGSGGSAVREECVFWRGTENTANTIEVYGGSVALQPLIYSSTGTAKCQTIKVINGTVRLESGATANTSASVQDSTLDTRATVPTLTVFGDASAVTVRDAATVGTLLTIDEGRVSWLSSGAVPVLKGGSGGVIDFAGSFTAVTVGSGAGTVVLDEGFSYLDPERRTLASLAATTMLLNRAGLGGVTLDFGEHIYLSAQAGP